MLRKRNRRRRQREQRRLPPIRFTHVVTGGAAAIVIASVYLSTIWLMDQPIEAVVIDGPFERVSAMTLEEALAAHVQTGFLAADLRAMQARLVAIPWVADARVRRRWPGTLEVSVTEQQAAACWRDKGLLNVDGELFVASASHIPAELPRLAGPAGTEGQVARLYFEIARRLEQRGLTAVSMTLDGRGAWQFELSNGIRVRLGARSVENRLERFLLALDRVIAANAAAVDYVDMRYTNGFAIGWKEGKPRV